MLVVFGTLVFGLLLLIDALIVVLWFAIDPWEKGEQILEVSSPNSWFKLIMLDLSRVYEL